MCGHHLVKTFFQPFLLALTGLIGQTGHRASQNDVEGISDVAQSEQVIALRQKLVFHVLDQLPVETDASLSSLLLEKFHVFSDLDQHSQLHCLSLFNRLFKDLNCIVKFLILLPFVK